MILPVILDFITIASTGDATDFGNMTVARGEERQFVAAREEDVSLQMVLHTPQIQSIFLQLQPRETQLIW